MSVTEITTTSWISRLGNSAKGIIAGLILLAISFVLLFWNEGRAVQRAKALQEGAAKVISVSADSINPANDGKLIHVSGKGFSSAQLKDNFFNIQMSALGLKRNVEMYQWQEKSQSTTEKKVGGSTEKTTTYSYEKVWSETLLSSNDFKEPATHQNPPRLLYPSEKYLASAVKLGAFELTQAQLTSLDDWQKFTLTSLQPMPNNGKITDGSLYLGNDPANPAIGDLKISYQYLPDGLEMSIVARQVNSTFAPFATANGNISLTKTGNHSAEAMFSIAKRANHSMTWVLRIIGFLLMFFGFNLIFAPLAVLGDVIPIVGSIIGVGVALMSLLLALPLSLAIIAIAWLVYRPVWAIVLLSIAGITVLFAVKKIKAAKASRLLAGQKPTEI